MLIPAPLLLLATFHHVSDGEVFCLRQILLSWNEAWSTASVTLTDTLAFSRTDVIFSVCWNGLGR